MSHVQEEKLKTLFAGLRRSTNRGIKKCTKCGTINGTRGNSCKNRACDVLFRITDDGSSKKQSTDACKLEASVPGLQIFSVRQRDRGPDYRSFVQLPVTQASSPNESAGLEFMQMKAKCYKPTCNKEGDLPCGHIQAAQRCFSEAEPLSVKQGTASVINIPSDQQQTISALLNETSCLVQRVSKTTFVVRCDATVKNPLGFLHIMFFHNKKEESIDKRFQCACKPITRRRESDFLNSSDTGESSKFCVHYHSCLMAFASDSNLATEFGEFLTGHCPQTLLSQLHLVTLPQTITTTSLDMDTNHIPVEIMQDMLESIGVDDVTLHTVQGLEGVLSDQIIVTNVDDTLTFGDPSALEVLGDEDSQVCQIFSGAPSTIQLTASPFTSTVNVNDIANDTVSIATSAVLTTTTTASLANMVKRKKFGLSEDDGIEVAYTISTGPEMNTLSQTPSSRIDSICSSDHKMTRSDPKSVPSITFSSPISNVSLDTKRPTSPGNLLNLTDTNGKTFDDFEIWLSGVNERLNAVMNYQFDGKPEPIVYYISSEFFDRLQERIISGVKSSQKKRLPNQTLRLNRTKPPAGTFTKDIWKIIDINHVMKIFHNSIIPLKIRQDFILKNGLYKSWTPPKETNRKNQAIMPHLHSTFLKVGKNDPNATESVPFVIEWTPEIFPQSKLGELSLQFEFGHCNPSNRDDQSSLNPSN